jgi:hypothetical protein
MRLFACDRMLATAAIAVAASLSASLPAASAGIEYPYCLMPGRFTPQSCTFTTLAQCQASQVPGSGSCEKNPRYVARPQPEQHPRRRR